MNKKHNTIKAFHFTNNFTELGEKAFHWHIPKKLRNKRGIKIGDIVFVKCGMKNSLAPVFVVDVYEGETNKELKQVSHVPRKKRWAELAKAFKHLSLPEEEQLFEYIELQKKYNSFIFGSNEPEKVITVGEYNHSPETLHLAIYAVPLGIEKTMESVELAHENDELQHMLELRFTKDDKGLMVLGRLKDTLDKISFEISEHIKRENLIDSEKEELASLEKELAPLLEELKNSEVESTEI